MQLFQTKLKLSQQKAKSVSNKKIEMNILIIILSIKIILKLNSRRRNKVDFLCGKYNKIEIDVKNVEKYIRGVLKQYQRLDAIET